MNTRILSSKDDLERALHEMGESLADDVKAYLIGGCAMILYNAKVATKDIDLVLLSAEKAESVVRALSKTGFKVVVPKEHVYCRLGTTVMMQDQKGMRVDIFVETVCRKIKVTSSIAARSRLHSRYGKLEVYLVSPEDIFLFKSVTEREGDLDDMARLAERGLDWRTILEECTAQSGEVILEGYLAVRLHELEEQRGIVSPIKAELEEMTEKKLGARRKN
ncbi:MAG: hypothetical protein WAS24_04345 [Thermoplasmata archaeon]